MLRDFEKYKINPPKGLFKSVEFVFTNPTSTDVLVNLFDSDSPPLPTSAFALPPSSALPPLAVGIAPRNIGYSSTSNRVYVLNQGDDTVTIINGATNLIVATTPVIFAPVSVAYNSTDNTIYVGSNSNGDVSVIDCNTGAVINTIVLGAVGDIITDMVFNPITNTIYAIRQNLITYEVVIIDCATQALTGSPIAFATPLQALSYNSLLNRVYVAESTDISAIDCTTNTVTLPTVSVTSVSDMAFNATNGNIYISDTVNAVNILDCTLNAIVGSPIVVGNAPASISWNSINNLMYVANSADDTVSVISCLTNTVVGGFLTGNNPIGIGYNSINNATYIANLLDDTVTIIANVMALFVNSSNYNLFVSDSVNNPKQIRQINLFGSGQVQLFQTMDLLMSDANGQKYNFSKDPNNNFSADQFQSLVTVVNFDREEFIAFASTTVISNYTVKANSSITMLCFYKEIKRIDMLYGKNISILEQMVNEISPDAGDVSQEQIDFNAQDEYYVRPDWSINFPDTKIASELVAKQLLEMKELNKINNINTL